MEITVTNWHGAPLERGGVFFPARDTVTADVPPSRLDEIRACAQLEIHEDPGDVAYCEDCDRTFASEAGLIQHRRAMHEKSDDAEPAPEEPANPHEQPESVTEASEQEPGNGADEDERPPTI